MDIFAQLGFAVVFRLSLIIYGEWQDRTMAVKYTDVDYFVFHDAAGFVAEGKSPYQRATYRYTPLLSWLLQPNILVSPVFGKLLFVFLDVCTGYLIYIAITARNNVSRNSAKFCSAFWLFNPLPITVSSRGNAESVMSCLVVLLIHLLTSHRILLAGIVYGLAVHFKIYPVTYALPAYLLLGPQEEKQSRGCLNFMCKFIVPTKDRVVFIISSALTFILLTGGYYYLYGYEFLEHTYFYHLTRKDIRHNFSVYFYMLYLQTWADNSLVLGLVTFIPQVLLLLVFSVKFYQDPAFVFFLHTFAFVTFNKVCTSQYFLWYLCLLPVLLPNLERISKQRAFSLVLLWFIGQGIWLYPAYLLEFQGQNTFLYIWLAGLVFFAINCYILYEIIDKYSYMLHNTEKVEYVSETESKQFTARNIRSVQNEAEKKGTSQTTAETDNRKITQLSQNSRIPRLSTQRAKKLK